MNVFTQIWRTLSALSVAGSCMISLSQPVTAQPAEARAYPTQKPIVYVANRLDGMPMAPLPLNTPPPLITSAAAVVMDLDTGTVVYAKNPLVPHYPASLTKVLTALVVIQNGHMNDMITTPAEATDVPPDKLYLVPGERQPLEKLLYGMLLISANDAAEALADHYGGSMAGFAAMMNAEAERLGATHTHFVNPSGLPDAHHVTTAYDMALMVRAAMQYPVFRQIVQTKSYDWRGQAWSSQLININPMLFQYPGAIGVKTGYTDAAHETLAVAAERHGERFLAVLLDAPLNAEIDQDATNLLNYAFDEFRTQRWVAAGQLAGVIRPPAGDSIPVTTERSIYGTVAVSSSLRPTFRTVLRPVNGAFGRGEVVGTLDLLIGGRLAAADPLLATRGWSPPPTDHPQDFVLLAVVAGLLFFMLRYNKRSSMRRRTVGSYPSEARRV